MVERVPMNRRRSRTRLFGAMHDVAKTVILSTSPEKHTLSAFAERERKRERDKERGRRTAGDLRQKWPGMCSIPFDDYRLSRVVINRVVKACCWQRSGSTTQFHGEREKGIHRSEPDNTSFQSQKKKKTPFIYCPLLILAR